MQVLVLRGGVIHMVIVLTVVVLISLVSGLFYVYTRYCVFGVIREKLEQDGRLRLPAYSLFTGRWSAQNTKRDTHSAP